MRRLPAIALDSARFGWRPELRHPYRPRNGAAPTESGDRDEHHRNEKQAQPDRILGHASIAITLDVYTHLFDDARHARGIRERMTESRFAALLNPATSNDAVAHLRGR